MHFALNRVRIEGFQQHSPNCAVLLKPLKRKLTGYAPSHVKKL